MVNEIRFRLSNPRHVIDKKVIFNAPRDSSLRKIIPFLQQWLAKNGHHKEGDGRLRFVRDGVAVDVDTSFLAMFGPSAGTQKDPATLEFVFEKEKR